MYIVVKYKIHLYSLQNRPEKLAKGSLFCLFLKLVQINFIFTVNVRILYIYQVIGPFVLFYRIEKLRRFVKSITKKTRPNLTPIIVPFIYRLEHIGQIFER
jgi:hypothetical protein